MSIIAILAVILAWGLSLRRVKSSCEKAFVMDPICTDQLKGIAIVLVILGHFYITGFLDRQFPSMSYFGAVGVTIFLFLSGYGLTKSFLRTGKMEGFLVKRVSKVWLPYFLVTVLWLLLDYGLGQTYTLKTVLTSLVALDFHLTLDATMWYITFIFMWYGVFFLVFRIPMPNVVRMILLVAVVVLIKDLFDRGFMQGIIWQWELHALAFPVGVASAFYTGRIGKWISQEIWLWIFSGLGCLGIGMFVYFAPFIETGQLQYYILANAGLALVFIILTMIVRFFALESVLFKFLGSISYEIYLCEAVFMYKYPVLHLSENKLIGFIAYAVAVIFFSIGLQKLTGKIFAAPGIGKIFNQRSNNI